ncbi:MBOAT family protein [Lachnospiraceae bacterium ASD3451]|uniref:MBOAT family O-acyltransferase n=1 Tax=Diplocloster agilis TaxID=2850323 RepID=UPI001DDE969D|nr:MBOAT family O-acyltransferase [Diplocloster agilis]MBU9745005.1 MBOAT family protein [Diplocloster agilis]
MVFSSFVFLFRFLPAVLLVYFLVPRIYKNLALFLASLIFYAWGEPLYVGLMIFSTVTDYIHGNLVDSFLNQNRRLAAKCAVASSVIINVLLLGIFKYSDLLIQGINLAAHTQIPLPELPLPVGISFYTFQTMSYTIDIYRREARPARNIIDFGAFVALFPQLVAGPIVRYETTDLQLRKREINREKIVRGTLRLVTGLGKKVLLANNIGVLWQTVAAIPMDEMTLLKAWLGIAAFAFQIYFDFSGYSDMAIGLGYLFGFVYPENFRYPYMADSITDFWRRWHITLGTWFKEYVYFPLGGSRKGKGVQIRNLLIVWGLTGIWHGASLNFLIWGLYFAVLLINEKLWLLKALEKCRAAVRHLYALFFIMIGWVIFAFDHFQDGISYLSVLFGTSGLPAADRESLYLLSEYGLLLVLLAFGCTSLPFRRLRNLASGCCGTAAGDVQSDDVHNGIRCIGIYCIVCIGTVGILLLSIAYLVNASYNPFLYFRF